MYAEVIARLVEAKLVSAIHEEANRAIAAVCEAMFPPAPSTTEKELAA